MTPSLPPTLTPTDITEIYDRMATAAEEITELLAKQPHPNNPTAATVPTLVVSGMSLARAKRALERLEQYQAANWRSNRLDQRRD